MVYTPESGDLQKRASYRVEVVLLVQGKDIDGQNSFFLVGESNAEFYGAGQNKPLLSRIAAETGGKYYTLMDLDLPEEMTYTEHPGSIPRALPLWDMPILLFLFCLFLIADGLYARDKEWRLEDLRISIADWVDGTTKG